MINQLIETIGKEATVFESFLALLEKQQESLVANDTDGIAVVTDAMREKLVEAQLLTRQREELVDEIKAANAIEGDLNVTRLLEIVDENQASQLVHLRNVIFALNDKIAEVRNQNAMLLNRSREYIQKMIASLSRLNQPDSTYQGKDTGRSRRNNLALDRRV